MSPLILEYAIYIRLPMCLEEALLYFLSVTECSKLTPLILVWIKDKAQSIWKVIEGRFSSAVSVSLKHTPPFSMKINNSIIWTVRNGNGPWNYLSIYDTTTGFLIKSILFSYWNELATFVWSGRIVLFAYPKH